MIVALALIAYATAVLTVGSAWLHRQQWLHRSPRLGIFIWQSAAYSALASVVLAGIAVALPQAPVFADLADLLNTCAMMLRQRYSTPGGAAVATLGLMISTGTVARVGYATTRQLWIARAVRRRQRAHLALIAKDDPALGALVLEHSSCAAYCVPGNGGRIVVTSELLAVLDREQLAAVLAHERAHLHERHDLAIKGLAVLSTAFAFVPGLALATAEVARLAEMAADDRSARGHDRLALATALVRMAEAATPQGALGAGGSTAIERVKRLARPAAPLPWATKVLLAVGALAVVLFPLAVVAAPAIATANTPYCAVTTNM